MNNGEELVVKVSGLSKQYESRSSTPTLAIKNIDLTVNQGEIVCILGPSGAGKSTFLNLIAGLLDLSGGTVLVCGKPAFAARLEMSYVQQNPQLLPYRTVLGNAVLGLELRGELDTKSLHGVRELLRFLGLEDFLRHYPSELSGGMKQRVSLARTFAVDAPLLLCDEPMASLDYDNRLEIEEFFWKENRAKRWAGLFVTHHIDTALALGDRVVIFSGRPATILKDIPLEEELRKISPRFRRELPSFGDYFTQFSHWLREAAGVKI